MRQEMPGSHVQRLSALLTGIADVQQDCEIAGLSMDSRFAHSGELFLACSGTQTHGAQYINDAIEAGVAAVAWEPSADNPPQSQGLPPGLSTEVVPVPVVAVEDLGSLVGVIADRFYGHPSRDLFVVGITGTNGKTSCAQFIARALNCDARPCGVMGTLGYGLVGQQQTASHTTPDALRMHALLQEMRDAGARCVVMEVSSHGLHQGRVNGVAFNVAVFTNLSRDHLDYHGDEQSYAAAKRTLFELPGLEYAVINVDDHFGCELLIGLAPSVQGVAYGFDLTVESTTAPTSAKRVQGLNLQLSADGIDFDVRTPWGDGHVHSGLLGSFNASNLLASLSVLLVMGIPVAEACALMRELPAVPGRMEHFGDGHHQPLVVVDYAHTPDALKHVLQALRAHCSGEVWCLFGCGGDRDRGKRALMAVEAEHYADHVVVTDDNPRYEDPEQIIADIISGFSLPHEVTIVRDREQAIRSVLQQARVGDVVLVAGKGHEDYQLLGDQKVPFSDADLVQQVLQELAS
jgi:UDP-N-acetylmuramoyl-L-alanyl-D-glutamate--2,6-diaminopimelate ligase